MTNELDTRIAELEAKLVELREQGHVDGFDEYLAVQEDLKHLKEQKVIVDKLKR